MRRIFSLLGIPFLIIGLIWLGAVIYLQQSGGEVTGQTLLNFFVLAPFAAIGLWFGGKALYSAMTSQPPAAPAIAPATAQTSAATETAPQAQPLAILSAEIQTFAGDSVEQVLPELLEGKLLPSLSKELSDSEGLPIIAALHPDLEIEDAMVWLERWLAGCPQDHPAQSADAKEGARLLALLGAPLSRTLDTLASLPPLPLPADHRAGADAPLRPLMIKLFAPTIWQDALAASLREQITTLGGYNAGIVRQDPQRTELHHDAIRVAEAFSTDLRNAPAHALLLLVACDSLGSTASMENLEQENLLFSATRPQGQVPGEAAALLLIAPANQVPTEPIPLAILARTAWGKRQKPVNASGRNDAELLTSMLPELLKQSGLNAADLCKLISDCDQRSAWNAEAASLISAELRELDPYADHLPIGRALGTTGHASALLALALATIHARDETRPVLAASLSDPIQRSLAILTPWPASTI